MPAMNGTIRRITLILFVGAVLLGACAPIYPTPKKIVKGTSTPTPFLPRATFTPTPDTPPTLVHASSIDATALPSPEPSATPPERTAAADPTPTQALTPSQPPATYTSQATPTATFTAAPTNTPKTADPVVAVSVTTNCRTGPGVNYPRVGSLYPHQTAALVARHAYLNYWVINLPGSGARCWLWGYYANPSGSYNTLPVYTPPPSPTTASSTLTATLTPVRGTPTSSPTPGPSKTYTPIPDTPTPGSPPPPTPTLPPTNTPRPSNTPSPVPPTPTYTPETSKYCSYTSVLPGEEEQIKAMINDARADHGLPALKTNWNLKVAARNHGRDMTCNGMSGHDSSDGTKAWVRIARALGHGDNWCYNNWACTEIIFGGNGYWLTPERAFEWWMTHESQDPNYEDNIHKRMILHERMTHLGVGAIYYKNGSTVRKYYTVDFARP